MKSIHTHHDAWIFILTALLLGLTPAVAQNNTAQATAEEKDSTDKSNTDVESEVAPDESAVVQSEPAPSVESASSVSNDTVEETESSTKSTSSNFVNGFDCDGASWVLGEAGRARGAAVTFNPRWQATLGKIAACKTYMIENARCLRLQGHYDSHVFNRDIVHVFGTQEAAQMTRARSRAQTVESHLESLGFPAALVVKRPPPAESSFRGVLVDYEEDCFGAKQYVEAEPTPEPIVETVTVVEAVEPATETTAEPAITSTQKITRDLWTQLDTGALYLDDRDGLMGLQTALHLGWTYRGLYIKVLGTMSGTNEELHRTGYGGQAGVGIHTPWTDLGLIGGIRNNARGLNDPVGDQIQFVGVDAQQCVWRFSSFTLCLREAFAPLTRLERKLDLDNGSLVRINSVTTQPMQYELAVSLRYYFGEEQ